MASRKFNPKMPGESQWAHDRFYSTVGFCIESAIECGMMHLWATNRAPFYSEFWAHPAWSVGWMLFIPYWHDFHFWFIHRMIHVEPLSAPHPSTPALDSRWKSALLSAGTSGCTRCTTSRTTRGRGRASPCTRSSPPSTSPRASRTATPPPSLPVQRVSR